MLVNQYDLKNKIETPFSKYNKIKNLLQNPILKDMTVFFISPRKLVFDKRGQYCCRIKCKNYHLRCYCPPSSLKYQSFIKEKNLVIILAKTYDFSELSHFIKKPDDYNEIYLYKNRILVRRWAQNNFYQKIKNIYQSWGINSKDFFAGGFTFKKCRKCIDNQLKSQEIRDCIPMPSPEALGIDVAKSLEKLDYYIKFGVRKKMTKVAMLFTDINEDLDHLIYTVNGRDKPHKQKWNKNNVIDLLNDNFKSLDFKEITVSNIIPVIKKEFSWLAEWKKAVLWKTDSRKKSQIQKDIHKIIFMNNYYFALDFKTSSIFKKKIDYDGIEFY